MKLTPISKFTWIAIAIILYAYFHEYVATKPSSNAQESSAKQAESSFKDKIMKKISENETGKAIIETIIKKTVEEKYGKDDIQTIATKESGNVTIIDMVKGVGQPLQCGATATFNYDAYMSGLKFDSTKNNDTIKPITITLGKGQVIKGLEMGVINMAEGGRRKISIPPQLAYINKDIENNVVNNNQVITYDIELISINDGPYKTGLVPNITNAIDGSGKTALCGDNVKVKYSITKEDGSKFANGEGEVEFKLGSQQVPIAFTMLIINSKENSKKTAIIPHALTKVSPNNTLNIPTFKEGENAIFSLEVEKVK